MEVLAGARDERHLIQLRGLLARGELVMTNRSDFENAASLYRQCRGAGEPVRKMMDCLIGAISLRAKLPVLHSDADFEVLCRHTQLETAV